MRTNEQMVSNIPEQLLNTDLNVLAALANKLRVNTINDLIWEYPELTSNEILSTTIDCVTSDDKSEQTFNDFIKAAKDIPIFQNVDENIFLNDLEEFENNRDAIVENYIESLKILKYEELENEFYMKTTGRLRYAESNRDSRSEVDVVDANRFFKFNEDQNITGDITYIHKDTNERVIRGNIDWRFLEKGK